MSQAGTTTDHDEIRRWAEERGGRPSVVRTGGKGGILRFDFGEDDEKLEETSWEEFFQIFEESGLALLHQDQVASGETSRFFRFVNRKAAPKGKSAAAAKGASAKGASAKTAKARDAKAKDTKTKDAKPAATPKTAAKRAAAKTDGAAKTATAKKSADAKGKPTGKPAAKPSAAAAKRAGGKASEHKTGH